MRCPDLKTALSATVAIKPGRQTSGSANVSTGSWVDCLGFVGPNVYGMFVSGDQSGSADSQAHACKLEEADDDEGTGAQDVSGATGTIDADGDCVLVRGLRTKRYVRPSITAAFTGGTTPETDITAVVFGEKERT